MSLFKDTLAKDVKSVFINLDEFADEHILDGKTVVCIVDKDLTTGLNDSRTSRQFEGVFVNTLTIYLDAKDVETQPVEGQRIKLDDNWYFVRNVNIEEGIFVIIVEANEQ